MENELRVLVESIEAQRSLVDKWKQPAEPLLFETLRAIDNLFCLELSKSGQSLEPPSGPAYSASTWGVNKALARMIPDELQLGAFRLFPSSRTTQEQADQFLLQAGFLEKAERLLGWMKEGLVSARLDRLPCVLASGIRQVLVLKSKNPAIFREVISLKNRRWMSDLQVALDESWEMKLAEDHARLSQDIEKSVHVSGVGHRVFHDEGNRRAFSRMWTSLLASYVEPGPTWFG